MIARTEAHRIALRRVGRAASEALAAAAARLAPGVSTAEIDAAAAASLAASGARSGPAIVYGFPGSACVSINEEAAHGVPGKRRLQAGDIVSIDVCAELAGYYADCAASFAVRPAGPEAERIAAASRLILDAVTDLARAGTPLRTLGACIEREAASRGYTVVKDLLGHGTGRAPHEFPDRIESWDNPENTVILAEGMVVALEFFLSTGGAESALLNDGWTLAVSSGGLAAQGERTILVERGRPEVLADLAIAPLAWD